MLHVYLMWCMYIMYMLFCIILCVSCDTVTLDTCYCICCCCKGPYVHIYSMIQCIRHKHMYYIIVLRIHTLLLLLDVYIMRHVCV